MRLLAIILALSMAASAAIDSKSLFIGIGLGTGMYMTKNHVVIPAAKAAKSAVKKTSKGIYHVVTGRK